MVTVTKNGKSVKVTRVTGKGSLSKAERQARTRQKAFESRGQTEKAAAEKAKADAIAKQQAQQKALEQQQAKEAKRLREKQVAKIQKDFGVSRSYAQYMAKNPKALDVRAFVSQSRRFKSGNLTPSERNQLIKQVNQLNRKQQMQFIEMMRDPRKREQARIRGLARNEFYKAVARAPYIVQGLSGKKPTQSVLESEGFTSEFLGDTGRKQGKKYKIPERLKPSGTVTEFKDFKTANQIYNYLKKSDPKLYNAIITSRRNFLTLPADISLSRQTLRKKQSSKKTISGQTKLAGLAFADGLIQNVVAVVSLPKTIKAIVKNPSLIKSIGKNLLDATKQFSTLVKTSPIEATARIGAEIVFLKGTSAAIRAASRLTNEALVRLNPRFVGSGKIGRTLRVPLGNGKTATLQVVGKIPLQKISKQLSLAGKRINFAVSSQADTLLSPVLSRLKKLAKPLGAKIPKSDKATTRLLKRLDEGTITKKEVGVLDTILKQRYGIKGVLERSFFVDPTGKIRPSRLGIVGDEGVSFLDIIKGSFTFRSPKPQILIFANIAVEKFPKYLQKIVRKLKAGKKLTRSESDSLLYFQTKQTGKFKPLGFVSRESELTLPQGEILKRIKQVGVTVVNGKRVPIILTEVYRPTKAIKKSINDFLEGKLTKSEIKKLNVELKRKTGINYELSSVAKSKKYISLKRLSASGLISKVKYKSLISRLSRVKKLSKTPKSIRSKTSKTSKSRSKRSITVKKSIARSSKSTKKSSKTLKSSVSKSAKSATSRASKSRKSKFINNKTTPVKKSPSPITQKKRGKPKKYAAYNVYVKSGRKLVKANAVKLTKTKAEALLRYIVGHSTSRSGKIVGVAGTPSKPKAPIPSVAKSQFRTPKRGTKLQKGSKVEKRKYAINTRGEKRGLKAAKLIRQRLSPVKKKSASKRKSRVSRSKPRKKVMRKRRVKRK